MPAYNDGYLKLYRLLVETNRQINLAHRAGRAAEETRLTGQYYRIQGEMRDGQKQRQRTRITF